MNALNESRIAKAREIAKNEALGGLPLDRKAAREMGRNPEDSRKEQMRFEGMSDVVLDAEIAELEAIVAQAKQRLALANDEKAYRVEYEGATPSK